MLFDLFTPVVPSERFHPAFRNVLSRLTPHDRKVVNQWAEGFVDRDGKFVKEFQTTFDPACATAAAMEHSEGGRPNPILSRKRQPVFGSADRCAVD